MSGGVSQRNHMTDLDFTREPSESAGVGSFKVGSLVNVSYDDLVRAFGEPTHGPSSDRKMQALWEIQFFHNRSYAHIYDWKQSCCVFDVTEWVVAGHDVGAPNLVRRALDLSRGVDHEP